MENNLDKKIINLYENSDFFKIYGLDFWITAIFIIVSILLIIFIYITNHLNKIKQTWHKERCNPLYLPFAGYINPQENMSKLDYTFQNFNYCNRKFISSASKNGMNPIFNMNELLNNISNTIKDGWTAIFATLNLLKEKLQQLSQIVMNKLISVLIPIQFLFIKIRDLIGKMNGTLVASIFTFYNLYRVIKLYFLNIIQIIVTQVLVTTIVTLLASIGGLAALLITWAGLNALALWLAGSFFGAVAAPGIFAAATAMWFGLIVPLMITIGIMFVFYIFIWTGLVLLNNFANEIFKHMNTPPIPAMKTNILPEDIKTTSDKSLNPLKPLNSSDPLKSLNK